MIFFAIRHKRTQDLMPQAERNKGYSHWNPDNPEHKFEQSLGVPRLFSVRRRAASCINQWAAYPNAMKSFRQDISGEYSDDIDIKRDNRKKDDLEVVEVDIIINEAKP